MFSYFEPNFIVKIPLRKWFFKFWTHDRFFLRNKNLYILATILKQYICWFFPLFLLVSILRSLCKIFSAFTNTTTFKWVKFASSRNFFWSYKIQKILCWFIAWKCLEVIISGIAGLVVWYLASGAQGSRINTRLGHSRLGKGLIWVPYKNSGFNW